METVTRIEGEAFALTKIDTSDLDYYEESKETFMPFVYVGFEALEKYAKENLANFRIVKRIQKDGNCTYKFKYGTQEQVERQIKEEKELKEKMYTDKGDYKKEFYELPEEERAELKRKYGEVSHQKYEIENHPISYRVNVVNLIK